MDLANLSEEEYFAAMKLMFNSDGWKILMAEFEDNVKILNDVQTIGEEKDLHFRKGQLASIAYMMNFQEIIASGERDYYEAIASPEVPDASI